MCIKSRTCRSPCCRATSPSWWSRQSRSASLRPSTRRARRRASTQRKRCGTNRCSPSRLHLLGLPFETSMLLVVARGVGKSYPVGGSSLVVLRDLDLDVESGEMVAIVGASGVGKSTLLHAVGGLDRVDRGTMTREGAELTSLPEAAVAASRNRQVGFVFQFHHLLPEFSALENTEMPMRIARLPLGEARARAQELLERDGV